MAVSDRSEQLPLRERKRLRAMKHVQRVAVDRFLDRGFERVTVEEVAEAAEVSPMSVYRWFGSKEGLALWDEFDPPILDGVAARLRTVPPLAAVRDALVDLLDDVYDRERGLALDRTRLIFREPALLAASSANGRALRDALAQLFATASDRGDGGLADGAEDTDGPSVPEGADVSDGPDRPSADGAPNPEARGPTAHPSALATAAVAVALLEVAVERWQADDGRRPLGRIITSTFTAFDMRRSP